MDIERRIELIARPPTEEIVTKEKLIELLKTKKRPVSYWGVAPTGPPHIGYYKAVAKQMDLISAGFKHKVLIADIHAYLDDMKAPWSELSVRSEVYKKCFQLLGLKGKNVEYVFGSEFQIKKEYHLETLRASALVTVNRALRAASEVVRMTDPKASSIIYPIMQSLDCWALEVDLAYAGIDNRHVYMLSGEILGKLNHRPPTFLFTSLGLSLGGDKKMSASEKQTRLEMFAQPNEIIDKIKKSFCQAGDVAGNPVLEYCRYLIFPRVKKFLIKRAEKFGGDVEFSNYEELEERFKNKQIHPEDLKNAVAEYLVEVLTPVREYFGKNQDLLKTFEK